MDKPCQAVPCDDTIKNLATPRHNLLCYTGPGPAVPRHDKNLDLTYSALPSLDMTSQTMPRQTPCIAMPQPAAPDHAQTCPNKHLDLP